VTIQRILDRAKKEKSEQNSPKAQGKSSTISAVQSVLDQYQHKRENSAEVYTVSGLTEPLSSKPVSDKSLPSQQKDASPAEGSDIPS
jgi:hypothetical protein